MNPILKNILAIIAGWIGGSLVNMALINVGHRLFPLTGVDPSDLDALAEVMPSQDFQYFIFPFLAHALGTLIGALIAGLLATNNKMKFSIAIGGLFLLGGIMVNYMIPGPTWFTISDIVLAYIPMAWLGGKMALKYQKGN